MVHFLYPAMLQLFPVAQFHRRRQWSPATPSGSLNCILKSITFHHGDVVELAAPDPVPWTS